MLSPRLFAITAVTATFGLVGCAQTPVDHDAHHPDAVPAAGRAMPMGGPGASMAGMDQHMTAMRSLHEQMANAKTPEERNALMAAHRGLMQSGMQMMGGMGPGAGAHGMAGMGPGMGAGMGAGMGPGGAGSGAMRGNAGAPADWAARQQWMEKRMEMMQSMMQLMVDRLPPEPAKK